MQDKTAYIHLFAHSPSSKSLTHQKVLALALTIAAIYIILVTIAMGEGICLLKISMVVYDLTLYPPNHLTLSASINLVYIGNFKGILIKFKIDHITTGKLYLKTKKKKKTFFTFSNKGVAIFSPLSSPEKW